MARYFGAVGYGVNEETPVGSGDWKDVITEHLYYGDEVRANGKFEPGEHLNDDISVQNSISIIADQYAEQNMLNIRYIEWNGHKWKVTGVQLERPRLILSLGTKYNGPVPEAPP